MGDDEEATDIGEAYPVGTTLDAVKIVRVEAERGLLVDLQECVLESDVARDRSHSSLRSLPAKPT